MSLDIPVSQWRRGGLDHRRDPEFEVSHFATDQFLADTVGAGRLHYLSNAKFGLPEVTQRARRMEPIPSQTYPVPTTGLLVQTAHACFAAHQGFGLSPDVVWQTICNQVATHIKKCPDRYASLFTADPRERPEIRVRDAELPFDNNWLRTLGLFEAAFNQVLGRELVSLFVPEFSTTAQLDRVAALITLMEAASPYYKYTVDSMCHIPLIRLEGTADDWGQLYGRAIALSQMFVGLREYFAALLPVLLKIAETARGAAPDNMFWSSLYKFKSTSGGKYVTGWLTALLAFKHGSNGPIPRTSFDWQGQMSNAGLAFKTNEIASLLSTAEFMWERPDGTLPMRFVAGTLGVHNEGSVYAPRLGIAVMER